MSRLLLVFKNELLLLTRDKRSLLLLFLMPALLVLTLSSILSHLYENQKPSLRVLIYSPQKTNVGDKIGNTLQETQQEVVHTTELPQEAHKNHDVLIKIPVNLPELLRSPNPKESKEKVEFVFYKFLDPFQKSFLMNEFVRLLQAQIIQEINAEISTQDSPNKGISIADPSLLIVETKNTGARDFPPLNFSLAAWSLFAIFFIVIPFSNSFYRDWNNDILLRLKSLHLTKTQVLGGRILAYFLVNFLQFFFLLFLGLYIFPMLLGSAPTLLTSSFLALAVVVFATSVAATAYALLISCITHSQEQASSLGAFGVVIMSLIGGIMVPTIFMPQFMVRYISIFSPLHWGLEGFAEAFQSTPDLQILGRSILILLFIGFSFYLIALKAFRWEKR